MKILEEKGYRYEKHLSTGGEGEVYLVRSVDKFFAVKITPRIGEDSHELLCNLRKMKIPNIPEIHEVFNHEDKTFIIMDYIEGNTLYQEIKKNGSLSLARAKEIILKICDTTSGFHNAKPHPIIYRDLKPENIIVMPDGDIRLIDFGIARYHKEESTRDTVLAGTRGYTAPEVMAGMQSDARSDIYSIGMLFYEMLTGKNVLEPPYQIRPVAESDALLPAWLDTVIAKATDLRQTARYSSVDDLVYDINNPKKIVKPRSKKRWAIIAAAAIVLVLAAYGAWYMISERESGGYEMMLELEFDGTDDLQWLLGNEQFGNNYAIFNDQLHVLHDCCNIDFPVRSGQIVHYKVRMPKYGAVTLGPFRVNATIDYECIYYNEQEGRDYSTGMQKFYGAPIKENGQFLDILLYTTLDNEAVYALVIDEYAQKIGYASYRIPDILAYDVYSLELYNFSGEDADNLIVERVKIAEGSVQDYLKNNFSVYKANKMRLDEFFKMDIDMLPEIKLNPVEQ